MLKRGDSASPEVFTSIAEVKDIEGPSMETDVLEVTTHSSAAAGAFKEKLATLIDAGEVSFDLNLVPSSTVHRAMRADQIARTKRNYQIWYPGSTVVDISFEAFISKMPPKATVDGTLEASVTLTITKAPTFATV
jgi:hypothetical protein